MLKRDQVVQSSPGERGIGIGLGVKATQERLVARRRGAKLQPAWKSRAQFREGKIPSRAMM